MEIYDRTNCLCGTRDARGARVPIPQQGRSVGKKKMGTFAIVKYHCEVAGEPTESVDYQVRHFDSSCAADVANRIKGEKPQEYKNSDGEIVHWIFDDIMAIEEDPKYTDGEEIIGFITRGASKE